MRRVPAHVINAPSLRVYTLAYLERSEILQYMAPFIHAMRMVRQTSKPHYFSTPNGSILKVTP